MKDWPPIKAWTSVHRIKNNRHFIAINYFISNDIYWVNLVSVIDGDLCFRVKFEELSDRSVWQPGWDYFGNEFKDEVKHKKIINEPTCLHPSYDSGLLINGNLL